MSAIASTRKIVLGLLKGTFLAQVISIVLLPIVAKSYTPEQMALLYLIGNVIVFSSPLVMLRLEQSYLMAGLPFKFAIISSALQVLCITSIFL